MSVTGRAAVVTGGGRGIGAATAKNLARAGARVGVAARTLAEVEAVAEALRDEGNEAHAFRCDVGDPVQIQELASAAEAALGAVDILVNNAGIAQSNPVERTTLAEWNEMMSVNATGIFLCSQALIGGMLERGWGRVVNIASVAGLEGGRYITAYAASKHAAVGFTRALAAEVAGTGVTVNAICPGWVNTPLTDAAIERVMEKSGLARSEALRAILAESGQTRLIEPEEVAAAVVRLCGEATERNGEAIVVDGTDRTP